MDHTGAYCSFHLFDEICHCFHLHVLFFNHSIKVNSCQPDIQNTAAVKNITWVSVYSNSFWRRSWRLNIISSRQWTHSSTHHLHVFHSIGHLSYNNFFFLLHSLFSIKKKFITNIVIIIIIITIHLNTILTL